jgi:putative isomerase
MNTHTDLTAALARGWNTWNTRSVLSHVLLPGGLALNLGLKEYRSRGILDEALIGRRGENDEQVLAGPRSWDGAYTELTVRWRDISILVQSAAVDEELIVLMTPTVSPTDHPKTPLVSVTLGLLWGKPGVLQYEGGWPAARVGGRTYVLSATASPVTDDPYVPAAGPVTCFRLSDPIGLSLGARRTLSEIESILTERRANEVERSRRYGDLADIYDAVHRVLAWDTIYDPQNDRVISPVSRIWNIGAGGYTLFDWDTYFAAMLAGVDNREVAYANALGMTSEITHRGFVPNVTTAAGFVSFDRSQPPVGSLAIEWLYRRFGDRWLLESTFEPLLTWNRWWDAHRNHHGYLCWGSNPYEPVTNNYWEKAGVGERYGGALESGLDNSPMYDDIPFNRESQTLELGDVGLMSMYIMDCGLLAQIADVLGRSDDAEELRRRESGYGAKLASMWDDEVGLFLNVRTDTGEPEHRLSPTHFYPLLSRVPTQAQAERMIGEHFFNESEFWGQWVLPSIARNDPAYPDQNYWRGRVWAPMNFLVYLGLQNYDLPRARAELAERSGRLLLQEWLSNGFVCENYNADTGLATDVPSSDRFYHWGALLGLIVLMEHGAVEA